MKGRGERLDGDLHRSARDLRAFDDAHFGGTLGLARALREPLEHNPPLALEVDALIVEAPVISRVHLDQELTSGAAARRAALEGGDELARDVNGFELAREGDRKRALDGAAADGLEAFERIHPERSSDAT